MIVGSTYLLAGVRVKVLARWRSNSGPRVPRNVLIEFPDGSRSVRPFRGLRKIPPISENPFDDVPKEISRS